MLKSGLPWILLAVVLIVFAFFWGRNDNKDEITRVQTQMQDMKYQRDSIKALVAFKDSMQNILQRRITELETVTDDLRKQVKTLETVRVNEQLGVRMLETPPDLKKKFASTFPELPEEKIKIFEEYFSEQDISLQYFGVPLWFSETFIIDHNNSVSYKEQKDKLEMLDSVNVEVISLHKDLFGLERDKSEAYRIGYDKAYTNYMDISNRYIDELEKPRFGWNNWALMIGSAAVGVIAGALINK